MAEKSQHKKIGSSLPPSIKAVGNKLNEIVISVESLKKLYGTKSNNSMVTTISNTGCLKRYVLKCASLQDISNEIAGTKAIEKYLPVPKIVSHYLVDGEAWLLRKYIPGVLMADVTNHFEPLSEVECLLELETEKEKLIAEGYRKSSRKLNLKDYLALSSSKLFYQRLTGERCENFYVKGRYLPQFMHKKISVNGKKYSLTLSEMLESILKKCSMNKEVQSYPAHGDAHHGNVIVSDKGDIWFFDNEYAGMMPVYMDLSKPYYNDLLGTLFFCFHKRLLNYFEVKSIKDNKTSVDLKISLKQKLNVRMKITQIKLRQRNKYLNDNEDFLRLNDYLLMCHMLNKNPNLFSEKVRELFLAFCVILNNFDPFDPESVYSYF